MRLPFIHSLLCIYVFLTSVNAAHTNNWAVIVSASRYWFNYRHMSNALGMYRTVKRLGIPDSNIILMLADDAACNTRNSASGSVFSDPSHRLDLYGDNVEVDYRGYEVTVENLIRVLTGRVDPTTPRSKRLLTDENSNIFVFMAGHGGNEFLKFQDNEEISAYDIADAFEQMHQKKRYNEIFFMIDTCQASTMYSKLYSPNILATGSSILDESSYSYDNDNGLGVAVIDAYTHFVLQWLESVNKTSSTTVADLFGAYDPHIIRSQPDVRTDLFNRRIEETLITDFLGWVGGGGALDVGGDLSSDSTPRRNETVPTKEQNPLAQSWGKASPLTPAPPTQGLSKIRSWLSFLLFGCILGGVWARNRTVSIHT